MKSRFLYMKILGLLLVIVGFSYTITSFYNFFEYIFGYKIFSENLNIYLMIIGLIIPVYIFIYGIYFYFYTDFNIVKTNKLLIVSNIFFLLLSIAIFLTKSLNINIQVIFEFIHISLSYYLVILSVMGIYGCVKFKY